MFSSDVVAAETQSAPLWEDIASVKKQARTTEANTNATEKTKTLSPTHDEKRQASDSQKTSQKRRNNFNEHEAKCKKRRVMEKYKKCRLCELQFNSEMELEDHLFSILHHRALNTEFGKNFTHECNLCGVSTKSLSEYLQHLQEDFHKSRLKERQTDRANGCYKRNEYPIERYTSTFLCPPKRAKQLKAEAEVTKKLDQLFAKNKDAAAKKKVGDSLNGQERERSHFYECRSPKNDRYGHNWTGHQFGWHQPYSHHPGHWPNEYVGHGQKEDDFRYGYRSTNAPKFSRWNGNNSWNGRRIDWSEDQYGEVGWHQHPDHYRRYDFDSRSRRDVQGEGNPYLENWHNTGYGNQSSSYNYNKKQRPYEAAGPRTGGLLPTPNRVPVRDKNYHQPEMNAQAMDEASKTKKNPKADVAQKSVSPIVRNKVKQAISSQIKTNNIIAKAHAVIQKGKDSAKKRKKKKKNLIQRHQSMTTVTTCDIDDSSPQTLSSSSSSPHGKSKDSVPQPSNNSKNARDNHAKLTADGKQKNGKDTNMQRTDNPGSAAGESSLLVDDLPSSSQQGNSLQNAANINQVDSTVNNSEREDDDPASCSLKKSTMNSNGKQFRSKLHRDQSKQISPLVLHKLNGKINKHLGPARSKKCKSSTDFESPSSVSSVTVISDKDSETAATERVRKKFREILDGIDKPVKSASEVLRQVDDKSLCSSLDDDMVASWAESSCAGSLQCLDNASSNSSTLIEPNSTQYSSLPQPGPRSQQMNSRRSLDLQKRVTVDSDRSSSTPSRDCVLVSSDTDSSMGKKRGQQQPNLNRARNRISKPKESPYLPAEARQAKFKQLLQKYDRNKVDSQETGMKKTHGPRFGIDLNLHNHPEEKNDLDFLNQMDNLIEILPEKRTRSLSENDSSSSYTTAATMSTAKVQAHSTTEKLSGTKPFPFKSNSPTKIDHHSAQKRAKICRGSGSSVVELSDLSENEHPGLSKTASHQSNDSTASDTTPRIDTCAETEVVPNKTDASSSFVQPKAQGNRHRLQSNVPHGCQRVEPSLNVRESLASEQSLQDTSSFFGEQRTSTPNLNLQRLRGENFNACMLELSEREEYLHSSVRSHAVQETNLQSRIDKELKRFQALRNKIGNLEDRKSCVGASKRKLENELEELRKIRLLLLRSAVPNNKEKNNPSAEPGNIFQYSTPTVQRQSPISFGDGSFVPVSKAHVSSFLNESAATATTPRLSPPFSGKVCHDNLSKTDASDPVADIVAETSQTGVPCSSTSMFKCATVPTRNVPTDIVPDIDLSRVKREWHAGEYGISTTPETSTNAFTRAPVFVRTNHTNELSNFDISRVKSELGVCELAVGNAADPIITDDSSRATDGNINTSANLAGKPPVITRSIPMSVDPDFDISRVKSERNVEGNESLPFPSAAICKQFNKPTLQPPSFENSNPNQEGNSTAFYSFNGPEDATKSSEIDKIVKKYVDNSATGTKNLSQDMPNVVPSPVNSQKFSKGKKRGIPTRKSPRINKETVPSSNAANSSPKILEVKLQRLTDADVPQSEAEDGSEDLPKYIKTHESPLVGMNVIREGLVTCSVDETVALHTAKDEKYNLNLEATPTAMTCFSSRAISIVFLATEKVVSQKQASNDSEVIKKVDHRLNIFLVKNAKTSRGNSGSSHVFLLHNTMKMKTRVLCMHYDKKTLFCGMRDGMAAIITLDSNFKPEDDVNILECHSHSAITCLTSGTEGPRRILCCGSADCTISVRDALEGLLLRSIQGHSKTVTCLQLVHNELFSAGVDRLVLGHDLTTGKLLHKFSGHVGVVRSLYVHSDVLVTLCSDRNVRFFHAKTGRMLRKPKTLSARPLHSCPPYYEYNINNRRKPLVYAGCDDGTVVRFSFPSIQSNSSPSNTINLESPSSNMNSSAGVDEKSTVATVNLTGEFTCKWEGCNEFSTFTSDVDLKNHVLSVHLDTSLLTTIGNNTLHIGTCCRWDSCTHYFAPELDTVKDVTTHLDTHVKRSNA